MSKCSTGAEAAAVRACSQWCEVGKNVHQPFRDLGAKNLRAWLRPTLV